MTDIKLDFKKCKVNIEKMFDIHDNGTVNIITNTANNASTKPKNSPQKVRNKIDDINREKPKTLKYFKHGDNGIKKKQQHRVDIVFQKLTEWKWIDVNTSPDDFSDFFEGEPRYCNITWTGTTTILTILLQELIKQPYIEKQTKCMSNSLVKKQFGLTPNSDISRLDDSAKDNINLVLYILDIANPIPTRRGRERIDEDITDAALKEVLSGQLRSTKGI